MSGRVTRRKFCSEVAAFSVASAAGLEAAAASASSKAKPFVKWAGGKGQLLSQLQALLPKDLSLRNNLTYVEPFVGGGAMLFFMLASFRNIKHVIINDLNKELINTYKVIKDSPEALIKILAAYQQEYFACGQIEVQKEYYLKKRECYNQHNSSPEETAAQFIFLNRTCFNGLYRVNSNGLYNVPFGKAKHPQICDVDTIMADSKLLQDVEILDGDFECVYSHIKGKAFVYFDPPYRPLPKTQSFTAYSKNGFDDEQQKRLAQFCRKLDAAGHQWMLSNSDPTNTDPGDKFFNEIFNGFDIQRVSASRMINSKADGRGKITELVIRNYKE